MPLFCDDILDVLAKKDLLTSDNQKMVKAHPDQERAKQVLNLMQWTALLNSDDTAQLNFNAVMKHPNLPVLLNLFELLSAENSLNQVHFDDVIHMSDLVTLNSILCELKELFLFNSTNFELIARHKNIKSLHAALITSYKALLLSNTTPCIYVQDILTHSYPERRVELFIALQDLGWLTERNYTFIAACPHMELMLLALKVLVKADLLILEHFIGLIGHQNPKAMETALLIIDQENLLSLKDLKLLISHAQPEVFASAIATLNKDLLRNDDIAQMHQDAIRRHNQPMSVAQIFYILKSIKLLNLQNSVRILKHSKAESLAHSLAIFMGTSFFTEKNAQATFDEIIMLQHPEAVASIFVLLQNLGLLTDANKKLIKTHVQLERLDSALMLLNKNGILTKKTEKEFLDFIFHHSELLTVIPILNAAGLLTKPNMDCLIKHQSFGLVTQALNALQKIKALKQIHFELLVNHQYLDLIAPILRLLEGTLFFHGVEDSLSFNWIMKHPYLNLLLKVLELLQEVDLLNQELVYDDFKIILSAPGVTWDTINLLQQANLLKGQLAQSNFKAAIRCQHDDDFNQALMALQQNQLMTVTSAQSAFETLVKRSDYSAVSRAYIRLQLANLLTRDLFYIVAKHTAATTIVDILILLKQHGLLNQSNRDAIVKYKNPQIVFEALLMLQKEQLLSLEMAQGNFDALVKHQHPDSLAYALVLLKQEQLLTTKTLIPYREALARFKKPDQAIDILLQLILIAKEEARIYLRLHPELKAQMKHDLEFLWEKISATVSTRMFSEYEGVYGHQHSEFIHLINTARFISCKELNNSLTENTYSFFQPNDAEGWSSVQQTMSIQTRT